MVLQDLLVGIVAVAIGIGAMLAAASDRQWCYRLRAARWIESRWGRRAARAFYVLMGLAMIALGVAIALGF